MDSSIKKVIFWLGFQYQKGDFLAGLQRIMEEDQYQANRSRRFL